MKIDVSIGSITEFQGDVIVVNLFEGVKQPGGGTGAVDQALGGMISDELENGQVFKGSVGDTFLFPTYGKLPARYVLLLGLGKPEEMKNRQLRRASAAAIRACKKLKAKRVGMLLNGAGIGQVNAEIAARLLAEGALMGAYEFTLRKSQKEGPDEEPLGPIESVTIVEHDAGKQTAIESGIRVGTVIANATNMARDLVNDTANYVTPTFMAETAQKISGSVSCKVLDQPEMEKLGMRTFLSVARGSVEPPKLIHLSYKPSGTPKRKVALVGKGITFDSGGLSLKPSTGMDWMKIDMTGAAVVVAVMKAISELNGLDIQVDAFAPCCENMPSGHANRPGDVIVSMKGKTIEINNTDAEGRLILADALTYAQQETDPDEIIDLATLTGACVVALGKEASGIMGIDDGLIDGIRSAGEAAGERYWPLPLYDEYKDFLKCDVADMTNSGNKGQAGSSAGGMFLKEFIDEGRKWVHLDIAGPAYTDKDVPEVPKGGTGVGVRTLLYYLYGWNDIQ